MKLFLGQAIFDGRRQSTQEEYRGICSDDISLPQGDGLIQTSWLVAHILANIRSWRWTHLVLTPKTFLLFWWLRLPLNSHEKMQKIMKSRLAFSWTWLLFGTTVLSQQFSREPLAYDTSLLSESCAATINTFVDECAPLRDAFALGWVSRWTHGRESPTDALIKYA